MIGGQSHQVDGSSPLAFEDELLPGSISVIESSVALSVLTVGQTTDFTFTLEYPGLQTSDGDTVQINVGDVNGVASSGRLFSVSDDGRPKVKVNDVHQTGSMS